MKIESTETERRFSIILIFDLGLEILNDYMKN